MIEDGKEITGKDAEELDKSFNKSNKGSSYRFETFLLPKKTVRVGESWKIDMERLLEDISEDDKDGLKTEFDSIKAEGSGKLVETYEKSGHTFGKITISFNAPLTHFSEGGINAKVHRGSKIGMKIHYDGCIDGAIHDHVTKDELEMHLDLDVPAPGGTSVHVVLDSKTSGTSKETESAKK
jgi:hypothetical protein